MTPTASPRSVNLAFIRNRAAQLGIRESRICSALGTGGWSLPTYIDPYQITLAQLASVAELLDATLPELLRDHISVPVTPQPAPRIDHTEGDDARLLAALCTFISPLRIDAAQNVLGWNTTRLHLAAARAAEQLESSAVRLVVSANQLRITFDHDALPQPVIDKMRSLQHIQGPLGRNQAMDMLQLVRDTIFRPFTPTEDDLPVMPHSPDQNARHTYIQAGLAVATGPDAELDAHPDLMFALGLTDKPSPTPIPTTNPIHG